MTTSTNINTIRAHGQVFNVCMVPVDLDVAFVEEEDKFFVPIIASSAEEAIKLANESEIFLFAISAHFIGWR